MPDLWLSVVSAHPDGFELVSGDGASPVILHVPHASSAIPGYVRAGIVLDDEALAAELARMTDAYTDRMALATADRVTPRPWVFLNRLSRLVVDPERFPDDREEMRTVGMGAVYTRTSGGSVLREPTPDQEAELIGSYFQPYAEMMSSLVDGRLDACGKAVIIDVHSYPRLPLPYELHPDTPRPELCIGADRFHTDSVILEAVSDAFRGFGEHRVNEPFAGSYVPLSRYGWDHRVSSIMLEIRRDTYTDEATRAPDLEAIDDIARRIAAMVGTVSS